MRTTKGKTEIRKGVFYKGEWLDESMDGYGILQDQTFSVYEGQFKDNHANGFGTIIFENGDHYQGEWLDGKMHGEGSYVTAKGKVYNGTWSNNKWINPLTQSITSFNNRERYVCDI